MNEKKTKEKMIIIRYAVIIKHIKYIYVHIRISFMFMRRWDSIEMLDRKEKSDGLLSK